LRECQEKETLSLSEKPAIKRLFGTKSKRSSKNRKVSIQESYSESDMEIEFENSGCGDDISAYCAKGFSRLTSMAKNELNM
jgi:hypothetical protein